MSAALLVAAAAALTWPAPLRGLPRAVTRPARPLASALDRHVPLLLAAAVAVLVLAVTRSALGLAGAVGAGWGVLVLLRRARRSGQVPGSDDGTLPLVLTVAGLLLRTGTPPPAALTTAARCCGSAVADSCAAVERRIAMGEPSGSAWAALYSHPQLAIAARAATRATDSGAALARAWESAAHQLKADQRLATEVRARKVGISALAPLGLCFLPSFVCLGVVPIIIGLAADIL